MTKESISLLFVKFRMKSHMTCISGFHASCLCPDGIDPAQKNKTQQLFHSQPRLLNSSLMIGSVANNASFCPVKY